MSIILLEGTFKSPLKFRVIEFEIARLVPRCTVLAERREIVECIWHIAGKTSKLPESRDIFKEIAVCIFDLTSWDGVLCWAFQILGRLDLTYGASAPVDDGSLDFRLKLNF